MAWVKICGLTTPEDAVMISQAGANYAGFVFHESSKRNLTKYRAAEIMQFLPNNIGKIAVVVSPTVQLIRDIEDMGFDAVQIHGELSQEVLDIVNIPVWRAYNIEDTLPEIEKSEKIMAYVIDGANYGSGQTFDWQAAGNIREKIGNRYLILAGGLNAENVTEAINAIHPDIVDVSSGVEGEYGKDKYKIEEFIRKVRENG